MKLYFLSTFIFYGIWLLINWPQAIVAMFVLIVPWLLGLYVVAIMGIDAPLGTRLVLLFVGRSNPEVLSNYAIYQPQIDAFNASVKKKKKKKKKKVVVEEESIEEEW